MPEANICCTGEMAPPLAACSRIPATCQTEKEDVSGHPVTVIRESRQLRRYTAAFTRRSRASHVISTLLTCEMTSFT